MLSGPFSFVVIPMKLLRDWLAVIVAALVVLFVKLGVVGGIPW